MEIDEIQIQAIFYDSKENLRVPIIQKFNNEAHAWCWINWLKQQNQIVTIEAKIGKPYGEEILLVWG